METAKSYGYTLNVRQPEMAKRLTDVEQPETEHSITVKINWGACPSWFVIGVMKAIGASSLQVLDICFSSRPNSWHRLQPQLGPLVNAQQYRFSMTERH